MAEASRQDLRLDEDQRRMLEELAEQDRTTVSELMRRMIAAAYEQRRKARRLEAVERIAAMEIEEMPDPDELSRQIAAKYEFERLH
jgi:hypothetical protein